MRGGISLGTQGRTGQIFLVPAVIRQDVLLITSQQIPESGGQLPFPSCCVSRNACHGRRGAGRRWFQR